MRMSINTTAANATGRHDEADQLRQAALQLAAVYWASSMRVNRRQAALGATDGRCMQMLEQTRVLKNELFAIIAELAALPTASAVQRPAYGAGRQERRHRSHPARVDNIL